VTLEIRDGELQCPFCKRVANLLVPLVPPEEPSLADGEEIQYSIQALEVDESLTSSAAIELDGQTVGDAQRAASHEEEVSWLQDLLSSLTISDVDGDNNPDQGDDEDLKNVTGGGDVTEGGQLGVMAGAFARHLSEMGKPQRRGGSSYESEPWRHSASSDVMAFTCSVAAFAYSTCAFVAEDESNEVNVDAISAQEASSSSGEGGGGGGDAVVPVGEVAVARRRRHLQAVSELEW